MTAADTATTEATILERATARAATLGCEELLEARRADRELRGVVQAFVREIRTEPIDDRRAMLEAAAVEALVIEHPAVKLARARRVLAELDPTDARELRSIACTKATAVAVAGAAGDEKYAHGVARRRALDRSPSRDALELLGLLRFDEAYSGRGYELPLIVTPRGELVIEILRAWAGAS